MGRGGGGGGGGITLEGVLNYKLLLQTTTKTEGIILEEIRFVKTFDKVWHTGLICKLQSYGIQSQLLFLLINYLLIGSKELL